MTANDPAPSHHRTEAKDRPRRRTRLAAALLVAVAWTWVGCGPPDRATNGPEEWSDVYDFNRAKTGIIRVDTRNGRSWAVPLNGDGGWIEIGTAPDLGDEPPARGRFKVIAIGQRPGQIHVGGAPPAIMLRIDHVTGRGWLLESEKASSWTPIRDPQLPETPASATPAPATPAATVTPTPVPQAAASNRSGTADDFPILTGDALGVTPEERQETFETLHNALVKEGMPQKMRVWAVRQLGVLDPEMSVPELLSVLDDPDGLIVAEAVEQLGQIGQASTLPRILALRNHPDERVQAAVSKVVVAVD